MIDDVQTCGGNNFEGYFDVSYFCKFKKCDTGVNILVNILTYQQISKMDI